MIHRLVSSERFDGFARRCQRFANRVFSARPAAKRAKDFLNGTWLGHPLHPALTDVPIGAWTVAEVLDLLDRRPSRTCRAAASAAIATGLAGAGIAAVSGFADWVDAGGRQRPLGALHAITNAAAIVAFASSLGLRHTGRQAAGRALSAGGFALAMTGAWLGGHLVFRLGNQVDRNAWTREVRQFEPVMKEADLRAGELARVMLRRQPVLLYRDGDEIFALSDTCSHAGCSLSTGRLERGLLICPCHGSAYLLSTGEVVHGPSPFPQPRFEARVRNGQIELRAAPPDGRQRLSIATRARRALSPPKEVAYRSISEAGPFAQK